MSTQPLLERADDLRELSSVFDNTVGGAGSLVIVRGESGVGKTALVTEFAANAEKSGAIVLRGRADRLNRSIPFAPVVQSLLAHLDGENDALRIRLFDGLSDLGRLIVDDELPASEVSTPEDPSPARMFEAVSRLVGRLADRAPVLWWIDDIDRADSGTIEFLHFTAERLAGRRVMIVLCCRPFTRRDLEILARPAAGRVVVDLFH